MSVKEYPNPSQAHPHRCAFLLDKIIDATHPWNKEELRLAYQDFRYCMKNKEVNADMSQRPHYVTTRENYEELFNSEKAKAKSDKIREEEKRQREERKKAK